MKIEKEEIRVYVIDINKIPDNFMFYEATDLQVIEMAEKTGGIYSLKGFQQAFNNDDGFASNIFIRII